MTTEELKTLTDEKLAELASLGDAQAVELLLQRYKDSVRAKARLYYILGADNDDVIQEGMIGLYKAVQSFKPEKGAGFRSFADRCITAQILTAITAANTKKNSALNMAFSLDKPLDFDSDDAQTLADIIASGPDTDPEQLTILRELEDAVHSQTDVLFSKFEREVFQLLCDGRDYREIAAQLHRTPKAIDNAMQRIRLKIIKKLH